MAFPRLRPAGDQGLLVEFGDAVDVAVSERVLAFDAALRARPFAGFTESVPSYAAVLVGYDPLEVAPGRVRAHVEALLAEPHPPPGAAALHELPVCYEQPFAPDLPEVAQRCGISEEAVIAAHLAGEYRVFMFGFAPGYGYLGGVPEAIRLPRKANPVRGRPPGSVVIAGPMCLVTTVTAPTGWWLIGRSPARIVDIHRERQFLFDVGDQIRFRRITRAEYDLLENTP
ncbi:MAG TPA: allophanate hydrolase subunit 1 [Roseomonas sp.]|nr:allophanate hydrolase subunit 1 [Roseomonas sp.]